MTGIEPATSPLPWECTTLIAPSTKEYGIFGYIYSTDDTAQ